MGYGQGTLDLILLAALDQARLLESDQVVISRDHLLKLMGHRHFCVRLTESTFFTRTSVIQIPAWLKEEAKQTFFGVPLEESFR